MEVTEHNDIKVYNLSAGKSLPQFLEEAKKNNKSLKYNEDFRKRVDLLQDFEFSVASSRVRVSPDGSCIASVGIYPPQVRLFETKDLGMRCLRGLDSEVVDFLILSEDYRKMVFLQADRTLEFHAQYGRHHRMRVPKAGRSLCYDVETCMLFVGGSSSEVVVFDLEAGGFQSPLALRQLEEVNCLSINPMLPVLSCAGNLGVVESFDVRAPSQALKPLQVCLPEDDAENGVHVTACAYSPSGMLFAAGTAAGIVRVYDVRSSRALVERDHMNGFPIKSVVFHSRGTDSNDLCVGAADCRSIKVWDASSAKMVATIESKAALNQIEFYPRSGMIFAANDQQRIGVFYVPALGMAPPWCSFLDTITEELEESKQKVIFDNYQFVTTEQLEELGATELVGSKFLQPYLHGYFMDMRLYSKLKAATDPFAYEKYRKQRIQQKLEAKRTMRTRLKSHVKVNPRLHKQWQVRAEEGSVEGASKKRKEHAETAKKLLADERFQALFADPDFAIEEAAAKATAGSAKPATVKSERKKRRSKA